METHLNFLLLIGIGIFFGLGGGKIFQKLKIPQVVGYIIIGVILGDSFLGLFDADIIKNLAPVNSFALGLIGFMIGGELKLDLFKKYGKNFFTILLWEGILTFILVTLATTLLTGKLYIGILFGALASATAPAATVDVLWEYKSKGILTTTILAIVALDDGLALIIYGFSSAFAKSLLTGGSFSFATGFATPLKDISLSLLLGAGLGYLLYRILLKIHEREHFLVLSIGAILVSAGLSSLFELDLILTSMTMGTILANLSPRIGKIIFDEVKSFTPPIYVLFFVLVGARLRIDLLPKMGLLGAIYIIVRMTGKIVGSYFGAVVAHADDAVRKYLGTSLFSQAGVAIGLAIAIDQSFGALGAEGSVLRANGEYVGSLIINVIAATTFIVQVIGPSCVKFSIAKADEIGKNTTDEDLLNSCKVEQVMVADVKTINTKEKLSDVMATLRNSSHVHFPLVNKENIFQGVISFQNVKEVMFEGALGATLLAEDITPDPAIHTYPDEPLKSAMDKLVFETINFLPVLKSLDSKELVGILHRKDAEKYLKNKVLGKMQGEIAVQSSANIVDLLSEDRIIADIKGSTKREAIDELAAVLARSGDISDKDIVVDHLIEREQQASTGIGNAIAIPHARTEHVNDLSVVFGKSQTGIDFSSLDGEPVHLIFLILAPLDRGDALLKLMGSLSRLLRNNELNESLLQAENSEEILRLLRG